MGRVDWPLHSEPSLREQAVHMSDSAGRRSAARNGCATRLLKRADEGGLGEEVEGAGRGDAKVDGAGDGENQNDARGDREAYGSYGGFRLRLVHVHDDDEAEVVVNADRAVNGHED